MRISFDCGCSFDANGVGRSVSSINFSINDINLDCQKTWSLLSDGNTKGVFQLESRLGQSMSKKLKPENIEQLAALISIMRPGCLEAVRDDKTVSNHFIDKKNGLESVDYFHPSLEPILKNTYGEMVYQEQAMEIAKDIAGFNLQDADMLRKAIGKKKPEEMGKVKSKFIDGCKNKKIVSETEADQIFGWIEKSQRYSFNKSHAVSYAINAYLSAFTKAHFPLAFFLSYLRLAKDKIKPQEEILELIINAKTMGIEVYKPNLCIKNKEFVVHEKKIYFGLTNIKNVGESVFEKLNGLIQDIDLAKLSW
jgi:DNA polymerase-3 subunit alpha